MGRRKKAGDEIIDEGDPRRVLRMTDGYHHDDLVNAVADNLAADPDRVHEVYCLNPDTHEVKAVFHNESGPTVNVDGILETLNMRDWRMVCDRFICRALGEIKLSPAGLEWPAPDVTVEKKADPEENDIVKTVSLVWHVDKETYGALLKYAVWHESRDDCEEEICCECDAVIRYVPSKGAKTVTCPECGAVNPLCNVCRSPAKPGDRCDACRLSKKCAEINAMRAKWR